MLKALGIANVLEAEDGAGALALVRAHRESLMLIVHEGAIPRTKAPESQPRLPKKPPQTPSPTHTPPNPRRLNPTR